ncbi:MAG TPA: metallopeptidase TldD-related protein [Vicinamibacterales bacterium]|jgi:predicted Zn-dependent protease|nr:metallopeptidase TldD-related protein [Vicinamibacterales bacterium]
MTCLRRLTGAALAVLLFGAALDRSAVPAAAAAANPLVAIMQSELQRNFSGLKKEAVPPYYLSYTVHDVASATLIASFGAVERNEGNHQRLASVEVRVGDYTLDNTHPMSGEGNTSPRVGLVSLPLTDDDTPIRVALWRATDRAFKQASEALTRAKTNTSTVKPRDGDVPVPDFSREPAQAYSTDATAFKLDSDAWAARLRRLSAPFATDPMVLSNDVSLACQADNRYYANSDGSQIADGDASCRLFIQAATKADDGMDLPLYQSYFARTADGLPDDKQLASDVRDMMALLAKLRRAPLVDPYSGPAILSGRAAGVFFHEIFGHRVEGQRQKNADDGQTFANKVDQPVLPAFLSVIFDPTLKKIGPTELMGYYRYDDEGVKGQRVTVVDKGILKTFLLSRAPLPRFPESNGHGRAQVGFVPTSRQSNLVVESTKSVSQDALVEMLRQEAKRQGKPFGLLFENIEGGFTFTSRSQPNAFNVMPNVVYRIYTDSREPELVRGVDLIGTPLAAFAKIVATGDKMDVFNGICGAESGSVPVSASAPAMLVSEVEVQKKAQSQDAGPILPAPQPRTKS